MRNFENDGEFDIFQKILREGQVPFGRPADAKQQVRHSSDVRGLAGTSQYNGQKSSTWRRFECHGYPTLPYWWTYPVIGVGVGKEVVREYFGSNTSQKYFQNTSSGSILKGREYFGSTQCPAPPARPRLKHCSAHAPRRLAAPKNTCAHSQSGKYMMRRQRAASSCVTAPEVDPFRPRSECALTWRVKASPLPRSFRLPIFLRPLRAFPTRISLNGTGEHDTPEKSPVKPRDIPTHRAAPACANARRRPALSATPPLFSAVSRPTGASSTSHPPRCKKSGRKSPSPRLRRGRAALANALLSAPPAPAPRFSAPCRALRARQLLPISPRCKKSRKNSLSPRLRRGRTNLGDALFSALPAPLPRLRRGAGPFPSGCALPITLTCSIRAIRVQKPTGAGVTAAARRTPHFK